MTDQESIVLRALVTLARVVDRAFDDSEEIESGGERVHSVSAENFDDVCEQLATLDDLPDDKPGLTLGPGGKAEWALRRLMVEADQVEAFGPTVAPRAACTAADDVRRGCESHASRRQGRSYSCP